MKKKYILKKRIRFKKRLNPATKRYYNTLHRLNSRRVKKILQKRPKAQNQVRSSIQILLLVAIYYFLINLVMFLQNTFSFLQP